VSQRAGSHARAAASDGRSQHGFESAFDDLGDSDQDLLLFPSLRPAFKKQHAERLREKYLEADDKAWRYQKKHKSLVWLVAASGTLAVICAILQLSSANIARAGLPEIESIGGWIETAEFLSALLAVLGIAINWKSQLNEGWLLERHKAERFRLLKFSTLIDPALLSGLDSDIQTWKAGLRSKLKEIEELSHEGMERWAQDAYAQALRFDVIARTIDAEGLRELITYYQDKRLEKQKSYFYSQWKRGVRGDWSTKLSSLLLFFLSIGFALLHGIIGFIGKVIHSAHLVSESYVVNIERATLALILLAALFPVIVAGLKTLRAAFEFSRNNMRFHSMYLALSELHERLIKHKEDLFHKGVKTESIIQQEVIYTDLWWCEHLLETEHREWLRLMIDAEWFG
jgi:hypothetical protein